jgi:hypothetical protein
MHFCANAAALVATALKNSRGGPLEIGSTNCSVVGAVSGWQERLSMKIDRAAKYVLYVLSLLIGPIFFLLLPGPESSGAPSVSVDATVLDLVVFSIVPFVAIFLVLLIVENPSARLHSNRSIIGLALFGLLAGPAIFAYFVMLLGSALAVFPALVGSFVLSVVCWFLINLIGFVAQRFVGNSPK